MSVSDTFLFSVVQMFLILYARYLTCENCLLLSTERFGGNLLVNFENWINVWQSCCERSIVLLFFSFFMSHYTLPYWFPDCSSFQFKISFVPPSSSLHMVATNLEY